MNARSVSWLLVATVSIVLWQNCSGNFKSLEQTEVEFSSLSVDEGDPEHGGGDPDGLPVSRALTTSDPHPVIRDYQPVIASRSTACIMCHASLNGNVITDFGYGNDFYFNSPGAANDAWYGDYNHGTTWSWGSVKFGAGAQVFAAKAPTATMYEAVSDTLAEYLRWALSQNPSVLSRAAVVNEVESMYIGAPTEDRIRGLGKFVNGEKMKFFPAGTDSAPFSGVTLKPGKEYYSNSPGVPIVCDGDLIIDGVLHLLKPMIVTYHGCRIYSTKTVFITGPIEYNILDSQSQNLQVVSSAAILLGVGHGCNKGIPNEDSYSSRIKGDNIRGHGPTFKFREKDMDQMLGMLKTDADLIGTDLKDATCYPELQNVPFLHVVLVAPHIQSRYSGVFTGTMVAEILFTALGGKNSMSYDPVFKRLPILPLLKPEEFLSISK